MSDAMLISHYDEENKYLTAQLLRTRQIVYDLLRQLQELKPIEETDGIATKEVPNE